MITFRDLGEYTKYPVISVKPKETSAPKAVPEQLFRERGWLEIKSSVLGCNIYLVQDPKKFRGKKYPAPPKLDLAQYTPDEIVALKGLAPDAVKLLHQVKTMFKGIIKIPQR